MNRKIYTSILAALVCLTLGLMTACSSSSSAPTIAISATSGSGQTQTVNEAFSTALVATVTSNGSPASGVTVTFAAPSSGASCTPSATTGTTASDGTASITCTANGTAGGYAVTASATGATTSASFSETNAAPSVFVFYVSGQEEINEVDGDADQYAIAGAVALDLSGNILGGEQDYNDGNGIASPEPNSDAIAPTSATPGSSLTVDQSTGTGTLVLVSSNTAEGVGGTETFAVQFINSNHALITQFDGSATSSGSMDLQSAIAVSGNYAFTLAGVDEFYDEVSYGGVFTDASGAISATVDENDADGLMTNNALTATDNGVPTTDAYGRGSITGFTDFVNESSVSLNYYVVGPEAVRLIDVDTSDMAVGSAYGQGTGTFDGTALGTADVFALQGIPWGYLYAATGNLVPSGATTGVANASFAGEGDYDDEEDNLETAVTTGGTYTIASDGYGSITFTTLLVPAGGSYSYGIYATDPALNLLDPNNTSGGGGALVLDQLIPGGAGVVVPQVATTATDFNSNSYGFGAQAFTDEATANDGWEFDFVGQGTYDTSDDLTATASISDPNAFFVADTPAEYTGVTVVGTASGPDDFGRYTYPVNPFAVGPVVTTGSAVDFTTVLYEASPAYAFAIDEDSGDALETLWLGTYQEQSASSLKALHVKHAPMKKSAKTQKPKQ
jgi:hypothetical protein